jgi:hypothetical protein
MELIVLAVFMGMILVAGSALAADYAFTFSDAVKPHAGFGGCNGAVPLWPSLLPVRHQPH